MHADRGSKLRGRLGAIGFLCVMLGATLVVVERVASHGDADDVAVSRVTTVSGGGSSQHSYERTRGGDSADEAVYAAAAVLIVGGLVIIIAVVCNVQAHCCCRRGSEEDDSVPKHAHEKLFEHEAVSMPDVPALDATMCDEEMGRPVVSLGSLAAMGVLADSGYLPATVNALPPPTESHISSVAGGAAAQAPPRHPTSVASARRRNSVVAAGLSRHASARSSQGWRNGQRRPPSLSFAGSSACSASDYGQALEESVAGGGRDEEDDFVSCAPTPASSASLARSLSALPPAPAGGRPPQRRNSRAHRSRRASTASVPSVPVTPSSQGFIYN